MPFKRTSMRYAHTNGYTHCTFTENGELIITCGSDGDMRTWQGIDDDDPSSKCLGEFVLSVVQYDERMLASTDLNVVQAYTFPEMDRDGTEFRFTAPATTLAVNKNFIAAGSEDTEIKVVKRDKSESEFSLQGHEGPILHVDLSITDLLASSSGDGSIKIWSLETKKEIKSITGIPKSKSFDSTVYFGTPVFDPQKGQSLAYPNGKEIIVLNTSTWEVQFTLTNEDISSDYTCCSFSHCGQYLAAGSKTGEISIWDILSKEPLKGEMASRESQCITSIVWNPKDNGELAYCDSTGQLGTVIGCSKDTGERVQNFISECEEDNMEEDFNGVEYKDDDEDLDNENCVSLERLKNDTMRVNGILDDEESKHSEPKSRRSVSIDRIAYKTFTQQPAFQPSATPQGPEHRYLAWNTVGIVKAHNDGVEGSIDVEFHDVNVHHALHMNNYLNHTMASLSSTALALSGDLSTKLVCIALEASGSREWSLELPDCEGIVAIAATSKLVAVASDSRFLRIFSVMGTQREVLSIPGPVVAICGHEDKLMVAYHSAPASEDQHISAMLLQTIGFTLRCREIRIPLAPGRKLTWIGYSDCGSPVAFDNMGLLQMYSMKTNCWYPICDTAKHSQSVSNNFFIIGVSESSQIIQAVLCRGSSYPMTNPRPMISELPMQIPLCEIETEKSGLEETLIRWSNFIVDNSEKVIKETAIKLFALACRSEMEARAKELIEMIASPQLLPLAVKYASKLGRIHLADKLGEMLPQLEEQEKEREKQAKDMDMEALTILQNSSLTANLLITQNSKSRPTTPVIAPRPMTLSHQKRNPFKRSETTSENSPKDNSLLHLTGKAVGFKIKDSQTSISNTEKPDSEPSQAESVMNESEVIPCSVVNENKSKNENNPKRGNFMMWFKENKENFKIKNPDATASELTKIAMKEYKALESGPVNGKRKLPEDEEENRQSGVSKLAKFACKN